MRIELNIRRLVRQCCVSIATLLIKVKASEPEPPPQVWMSALHLPSEMAERAAEWSFVLQQLDGFKFWSVQLDWNENGVSGQLVPLSVESSDVQIRIVHHPSARDAKDEEPPLLH